MTRVLSLLVLLCAGLCACAQTLTDIDTRSKLGTGPAGHLVRSDCRLEEDKATLSAVFTINDHDHLIAGERFDYELVVTNQSKAPVAIPRVLNWEDVRGGDAEAYSWASIDIRVDAGDGLEASLAYSLTLYGSKDKAWSEVAVGPGESVRILGSDRLPVSMNINAKPVGKGTLKGIFHLGTMRLYHTPTAGDADAYSTESRWAFSALAGERYPMDLETKP